MLEKHTDVHVSAAQMASMIGTLKKEDEVAGLTEEIRKVQSGNYQMPILPTVSIAIYLKFLFLLFQGPSSADAFNQPQGVSTASSKTPDNNEGEEVKRKEQVENGTVDIPEVDTKVHRVHIQNNKRE